MEALTPAPRDVMVYTGDALRLHFFDELESVRRMPDRRDPSHGYIVLTFKAGGELSIHTDEPLLWIEPERH